MKGFVSPQTGSEYAVVNTAGMFVSYRPVTENVYRVRIQGKEEHLAGIRHLLSKNWGEIKNGDHLSIVVEGAERLANAVGDAVRAVTYFFAVNPQAACEYEPAEDADADEDEVKFEY